MFKQFSAYLSPSQSPHPPQYWNSTDIPLNHCRIKTPTGFFERSISKMSATISIWSLLIAIASCSPAGLGSGIANHKLDIRDYPVSCGYNNLFPCAAGQTCYTSDNQAFCGVATAAAVGVSYQMYTTTYTVSETYTVTSTYSSAIGGSTGSSGTCAADETICNGPAGLCCNSASQWCDNGTTCRDFAVGSPGGSPGLPSPTMQLTTVTVSGAATTISNFVAPTSISVFTTTSTGSTGTFTTTEPFQTPVGSSGASLPGVTAEPQTGGGGLSGGAIAGIVIGVLVGLFILFIVLACLCCKGIFDLLFGTKKKKETTTYVHSHHSAHGSGAGRPPPRRWFGILPGKTDRPDRPEKKSSGLGGIFAVGGILTALLVVLGLKRRNERRREEEKSEYTVSEDYYYDDYTTSASKSELFH